MLRCSGARYGGVRAVQEVVGGDRMLPHLHPTDLIRRQQPRTRSQGVPLHRPLHSYHSTIMHRLSFLTVLGTKPYGHERSFSIKCSMLLNSLSPRDAYQRALTALRQKVHFNKNINDIGIIVSVMQRIRFVTILRKK